MALLFLGENLIYKYKTSLNLVIGSSYTFALPFIILVLQGALESLLAAAIVGITYALGSGQPLTILGSTGPVLVFETILHNFAT